MWGDAMQNLDFSKKFQGLKNEKSIDNPWG
jgi:hypothetical protein